MRVLVTGGAGYIGSHTLVELLAQGHQVCVLDDFSNSAADVLNRVEKLAGTQILSYVGDIRDRPILDRLMQEFRPEAVVHFAGLKAVGESSEKPLLYYDVNVGGTCNLLGAMTDAGCNHIIFSSTAAVYGASSKMPCDETQPRNPSSVYGRTKLVAEDVISDWVASTPGTGAVLLRYFNPVGAHASGVIGESPKGVPSNLFPVIAEVASGRRQQLSIFGDDYDTPDGTCLRDYIHVCDLAQAHVAALDYAIGRDGAPAFNIGTGQGYSVREMVDAFVRISGEDIPSEIVARRFGDIPKIVADPTLAAETLGWKAERGLDDMIASTWAWFSSRQS